MLKIVFIFKRDHIYYMNELIIGLDELMEGTPESDFISDLGKLESKVKCKAISVRVNPAYQPESEQALESELSKLFSEMTERGELSDYDVSNDKEGMRVFQIVVDWNYFPSSECLVETFGISRKTALSVLVRFASFLEAHQSDIHMKKIIRNEEFLQNMRKLHAEVLSESKTHYVSQVKQIVSMRRQEESNASLLKSWGGVHGIEQAGRKAD